MTTDIFVALRSALAVMFVFVGASKLADRPAFAAAVAEYNILPGRLTDAAASGLVIVELAVGIGLFVGVQLAAMLATVMLIAFSGAVAVNLIRGRAFDCGCGFGSETPISWPLVARDVALAAIAALVAVGPTSALAVRALSVPVVFHAGAAAVTQTLPIPMLVILLAIGVRLCVSTNALALARSGLTHLTQVSSGKNAQHEEKAAL